MNPHHPFPRNFVQEWIDYAEERKDDDFLNFFCYFLSLNYLFSNHGMKLPVQPRSEREMLTRFLTDHLRKLFQESSFSIPNEVHELRKSVKVTSPARDQKLTPKLNPRTRQPPRPVVIHGIEYTSDKEDLDIAEDLEYLSASNRRNDPDGIRIWECILLFHRIYQVRCNLFHGGKSVANPRDRNLVHESVLVMRLFFRSYLKVFSDESTSYIHFSENGGEDWVSSSAEEELLVRSAKKQSSNIPNEPSTRRE